MPHGAACSASFVSASWRVSKHDVDDDSPTLVGVFDSAGSLIAAFGLRDASSGFFCERYLDEPLEDALTRARRRPIDRHKIIEVTHLCASRIGLIRVGLLGQLLPFLPEALMASGFRMLACTATDRLAQFLRTQGVATHHACDRTSRRTAPPNSKRAGGATTLRVLAYWPETWRRRVI